MLLHLPSAGSMYPLSVENNYRYRHHGPSKQVPCMLKHTNLCHTLQVSHMTVMAKNDFTLQKRHRRLTPELVSNTELPGQPSWPGSLTPLPDPPCFSVSGCICCILCHRDASPVSRLLVPCMLTLIGCHSNDVQQLSLRRKHLEHMPSSNSIYTARELLPVC